MHSAEHESSKRGQVELKARRVGEAEAALVSLNKSYQSDQTRLEPITKRLAYGDMRRNILYRYSLTEKDVRVPEL